MSINFSQISRFNIPHTGNGNIIKVKIDNREVWSKFNYVSLGDSIAAGHSIDDDWEKDYGYESQYSLNGKPETTIVPKCYTDLLRTHLGTTKAKAISFARSGDRVPDLMEKLTHTKVQVAIRNANLVTISIGANDVLEPALERLESYITEGNPALVDMSKAVEKNLNILDDDNHSDSYVSLFDKLKGLNPNCTYVFTTVYNPLKYLWLDESTEAQDFKDGFFGLLMRALPDNLFGYPITQFSNNLRETLYNTNEVQVVFDRINGLSRDGSDGLSAWVETHVTRLNKILKTKIQEYHNSKFIFADVKALYDPVPDRPISANYNYNDLVNIEFTRGYTIKDLDWGQFWNNLSVEDLLHSEWSKIMAPIMTNIVKNVIMPDMDVHPEVTGHKLIYYSILDALDLQKLKTYELLYYSNYSNNSNNETSKQLIMGVGDNILFVPLVQPFTHPTEGYRFINWKNKDNDNTYTDSIVINSDSDLTELVAQWSNMYTLIYKHSYDVDGQFNPSKDTGPQECYELWVQGTSYNDTNQPEPKLSYFTTSPVEYNLEYGTVFGVVVKDRRKGGHSYIKLNDKVVEKGNDVARNFTLKGDCIVNFEWNRRYSSDNISLDNLLGEISYWNCYINGAAAESQ